MSLMQCMGAVVVAGFIVVSLIVFVLASGCSHQQGRDTGLDAGDPPLDKGGSPETALSYREREARPTAALVD